MGQVIQGFKRGDLAKRFAKLGFKVGAEIGVADGRFSEHLCKVNPGLHIFCIDTWEPYKGNRRYLGYSRRFGKRPNEEVARELLAPYNATFIKTFSMDALRWFEDESLDFVYIDANHDFDYAMEDIINWSRKVRKGGIVSGHDYYNFNNSGVIEAVDIYVKIHKKDLYLTDERETSWFFVK